MDKSRAIILACSPEPERICASAAKISTTLGTSSEIYKKSTSGNNAKLINKVLSMGHTTFIEHANFNIAFENVSVFVEQFLIEFRLASFTIKSRRYVNFSKMGCVKPKFKMGNNFDTTDVEKIDSLYDQHMDMLFSFYDELINLGIPKEDARFVLPYSFRSNFYCTVNTRELAHIIYSMIFGRGSKSLELKSLGESLLEQAKKYFPDVFDTLIEQEKGDEDKEEELNNILKKYIKPDKNFLEMICHVSLLSYTPEPDSHVFLCGLAGNTALKMENIEELISNNSLKKSEIINILFKDKRKRELEQINFTFSIKGISLSTLTHIVRHRIQSIIVPSLLGLEKSKNYVFPKSIKSNKKISNKFREVMDINYETYHHFKMMGVPEEYLVYFLISGNLINIITTMNGRELLHFIRLRSCNRAQWEVKDVAIEMLRHVRQVAPLVFSNVGPSCFLKGKCPEGKFSCGKGKEVKKYFAGSLN
ncbi:MAG: FAD-dependent thymidylate synthase [Desulfobulbaceae bacterium]|nr:FAD-dependent thymidylate synthase [Desulfobulbaceae bacterium]